MTELEQCLASAEGSALRAALIRRFGEITLRLQVQPGGSLSRDAFECHAAVMQALERARQCLSSWPVGLSNSSVAHAGLPVPASPQSSILSKEHLK